MRTYSPDMPSVAEIERHFAAGAETITLTRGECEAFYAHQQTFATTGLEFRKAQAEFERVKRVARPLWHAIVRVRRSMAQAFQRCPGRAERIPRCDVEEWERINYLLLLPRHFLQLLDRPVH